MNKQIKSKVISIISAILKVNKNDVNPESRFAYDLVADSLDQVEVIIELESEFKFTISDNHADNITTVGQAISCIEDNLMNY